jgi:hypothetical protein
MIRGAAAGAFAATVWATQEPLDMRVFGVPYSDAERLNAGYAHNSAPA